MRMMSLGLFGVKICCCFFDFSLLFFLLWAFISTSTLWLTPSFQAAELHDVQTRYGFLPACAQPSWRPSLNSVLLRHLVGSLFQRGWHLFVCLRLMSRSLGKLKKQTSNMAMGPGKTRRCGFLSGVPAELHWRGHGAYWQCLLSCKERVELPFFSSLWKLEIIV